MLMDLCRESGFEVCAVLDNNPAKWGEQTLGVATVAPQQLLAVDPDYVLVLSRSFRAIAEQAADLGYPRERVIDYHGEPRGALRAMGGDNLVCHYDYVCDGQGMQKHIRKYRVKGKVTQDIPCPAPLEKQRRVVTEVVRAFSRARDDARRAPALYRVGENWGGLLQRTWGDFYAMVESGDLEGLTSMLANYCRNPLSHSILGGEGAFRSFAAHPVQEAWLQHNLNVWMALADGDAALEEAAMPPVGNPYGYDVEGHLINWNSFVNHWRAHRCLRLLDGVDHPLVAEIGGGFGGFAYQLLRGDRPLTYIDFDLPENLLIASYSLALAFPEKRILLYDSPHMNLDPSVLRDYDAVMLPNFLLPAMADASVDFCINTISFSEMEYPTIVEYFSQIDRICSRYFYHENLSCHPEYKGFPSSVFPRPRHFRQLFVSFSPWHGLDVYTLGHSYLERLYQRQA
jgi:putative sugar O-methyltransferase